MKIWVIPPKNNYQKHKVDRDPGAYPGLTWSPGPRQVNVRNGGDPRCAFAPLEEAAGTEALSPRPEEGGRCVYFLGGAGFSWLPEMSYLGAVSWGTILRFVEPLSGEICHLFFQGSLARTVFTIFLELKNWAGDGCTHTSHRCQLAVQMHILFHSRYSTYRGSPWVMGEAKGPASLPLLKPSMDLPTAGFRIWAFNY